MVNRAIESLLYRGNWVGTYGRYVVCISEGCVTWPREIETVEAVALCSVPLTIRNGWYEFLEAGPGQMAATGTGICGRLSIDRGDAVAFDDVVGTGKKLAIYCDGTESGEILLRYWNSNGMRVYTGAVGERIEGEMITLPAAGEYAYSAQEVMPGGLYGVIKPVTNRTVRLYQYTTGSGSPGTLKPLAFYEPDETLPCYRRSILPFTTGSNGDCSTSQVTIVGKQRFIPAIDDNSYLTIQHPEAIRMAVQSIFKSDANDDAGAARYMWGVRDPVTKQMRDGAVPLLQEQLQHWQGSGTVVPIRVVGTESWGVVQNAI